MAELLSFLLCSSETRRGEFPTEDANERPLLRQRRDRRTWETLFSPTSETRGEKVKHEHEQRKISPLFLSPQPRKAKKRIRKVTQNVVSNNSSGKDIELASGDRALSDKIKGD